MHDPVPEARRKAWVQARTIVVCLLTAYLTRDLIKQGLRNGSEEVDWRLVVMMGVLAAGSSSFWNSVLTEGEICRTPATYTHRVG
jgi:hypothetical protein